MKTSIKNALLRLLAAVIVTVLCISAAVFVKRKDPVEIADLDKQKEHCGATEADSVYWVWDRATGKFHVFGTGAMRDYYVRYEYHYVGIEQKWPPWGNDRAYNNENSSRGYLCKNRKDRLSGGVTMPMSEVIIRKGVTHIGAGAFEKFRWLKTVKIPNTVKTIGDYAFYECPSLTSIKIPNGVTEIRYGAFAYSGLTSITIPGSVTDIGEYAFYACSSLTSVTLQNGVQYIERYAFADNPQLASVTIPPSVKSIGDRAFENSRNLASLTIGNGVEYIGEDAFAGSEKLRSVTIPKSVTSIGYGAFGRCDELTHINVDKDNPEYTSIGGVLFSKDKKTLIQFPGGRKGDYEIPSSVTRIAEGAFWNNREIASVTIPITVREIGNWAFSGCTSLKSVTLPKYIREIEGGTFYGSGLTSIIIPDSVKKIAQEALRENKNLVSVTLSNGLERISGWAFADCAELESITIPQSVKFIGPRAFENGYSLAEVSFPDREPVKSGDAYADYLLSKSAPELFISDEAFKNCTTLTSFDIPTGTTRITDWVFSNCVNLKTVNFPKSIKNIGKNVFENCRSLISINVENGNEKYLSIDGVLFVKDKFVSFYDDDNWILSYLMNATTRAALALETYPGGRPQREYAIPNGVTVIKGRSFSGTALTSITFPSSITHIAHDAFSGLPDLESITFRGAKPPVVGGWSSISFSNKQAPCLYVPKGSVNAYRKAFTDDRYVLGTKLDCVKGIN